MRKKNKKIIWISISIILLIIIGYFSFGFIQQSILWGGNGISCSKESNNNWNCGMIGPSPASSVAGQGDGTIKFDILKWDGSTRADAWKNLIISSSQGILKEFFNTHTFQSGGPDSPYGYVPYDYVTKNEAGILVWKNSFEVSQDCNFGNCAISVNEGGAFLETMGEEMIIVKGTLYTGDTSYSNPDPNKPIEPFETYGFCKIPGKQCYLIDPYPNTGGQGRLVPTSIKIYFKEGGYKLGDECTEFNINCPEEPVITIEEEKAGEITQEIAEVQVQENINKIEVEEKQNIIQDIKDIIIPNNDKPVEIREKVNYPKIIFWGIIGIIIICLIIIYIVKRRNK